MCDVGDFTLQSCTDNLLFIIVCWERMVGLSYYRKGRDQKIFLGLEKMSSNPYRVDDIIYYGDPARLVEHLY